MKWKQGRTRYANVTSTLALIVALGGTSYAATMLPADSVGTSQLKASAVTSGKVKDGALLRKDFKAGQLPKGATGAKGASGASGATGAAGVAGAKGDKGDAGSAVAFGKVASDGTIDLTKSKNIVQANVTRPSAGVYCFSGVTFTPLNVVANVLISNGGAVPGPDIYTEIGTQPGCPVGTQFQVDTVVNNVFSDRGFSFAVN